MDIPITFNNGSNARQVTATQYDYGQCLVFKDLEMLDGSEVDFYQEANHVTRYISGGKVRIPDKMLQRVIPISAYVFARTEDTGRTIFKVGIAVNYRPNLGNNPEPDSEDYRRLVPAGGTTGHVLTKTSDRDYDSEWRDIGGITLDVPSAEDIDIIFKE